MLCCRDRLASQWSRRLIEKKPNVSYITFPPLNFTIEIILNSDKLTWEEILILEFNILFAFLSLNLVTFTYKLLIYIKIQSTLIILIILIILYLEKTLFLFLESESVPKWIVCPYPLNNS